jgi:hypothetical protein
MSPSRVTARRFDKPADSSWLWPADPQRYDKSPVLSPLERAALRSLGSNVIEWRHETEPEWPALARILQPLSDARASLYTPTRHHRRWADRAVAYLLYACLSEDRVFWGWDENAWTRVCGRTHQAFAAAAPEWTGGHPRQSVIALSYLLGDFVNPLPIGRFDRRNLAEKVFGRRALQAVEVSLEAAAQTLGYALDTWRLPGAAAEALLLRRSAHLSDLTAEFLTGLRSSTSLRRGRQSDIYRLHRVMATMGLVEHPVWSDNIVKTAGEGVDPVWREWVERWYATSTLTHRVRRTARASLFKIGRWLVDQHPNLRSPYDWTRQDCAAYVAAVDRWRIADYTVRTRRPPRAGDPLRPRAKAGALYPLRRFFLDCQEWEWIPRRFDPSRALQIPRSVRALIGPEPRVIDSNIWAKLMWAGLNMEATDLSKPNGQGNSFYPIELVRAITVTWLFAGLRSDEIVRLHLGCIRWQSHPPMPTAVEQDIANDPICFLDVPTNKTGTSFTKPVDPLVGRAISAWEAIRRPQPPLFDPKTAANADFLFCHRGNRVAVRFVNTTVIPALCRKAGVPLDDARGRITSHRARATIASQLYNAKEPMTLFELQAWLGHRSPSSTQHYAAITPTTLARAYEDAGYFARSVRAIRVLVDRDAIQSGAAASGTPWQHFDLGHGYCTNDYFVQCPHRMACARCDFYVPKDSTQAQLLEQKTNLQRMAIEIPLTEEEHAAVEGDTGAVDQLLIRLSDVPTPAGPTPRTLGTHSLLMNIPLVPS